MLLMVAWSSGPVKNELMSPNLRSDWGTDAASGASKGVACAGVRIGAFGGCGAADVDGAEVSGCVTGAGSVGAGAGVEGATTAGGVLVDAAGVCLGWGYQMVRYPRLKAKGRPRQTFETMRTKKSFSLMLHDSTVFESARTLPEPSRDRE